MDRKMKVRAIKTAGIELLGLIKMTGQGAREAIAPWLAANEDGDQH